jgi:hypothetical protein
MELLYDASRGINNVSHTYSLARWPPRQDQPGAALAKQKTSLICIQYIPTNCSHQCSGNTKSKREPRGRPSGRNANQQQQEEQENEFPRGKTAKYEQERQHRIAISMRREHKKPVIPRAYSATDGKWTKRNQTPDKP